MTRFKVTLRDRSLEIHQADRVIDAGGRVRLVDEDGREVAAWEADEVHAIQEVDDAR